MERRKDSLSNIKTCRFCLCRDSTLSSIYDRDRDPQVVNLPLKILACLSIEVFPSDKMPSYICERCRTFMDICYEFKQLCRRADESCLQFVQNCIAVNPIIWPPSLVKIFQMSKRTKPIAGGGGNAIQGASHDMSENEDEETSNVKTNASGDGSKGLAVNAEKESPIVPKKEAVRRGVMVRVRRRSAGLGTWPCDVCDNSYSLHQLLEIHRAQKHRAQNVACRTCNAQFFSKYDFMTHQLRHTNETPFQCVACNTKFKRLILLKRHEKMVHADLPRHLCKNCPVTFLSKEELEAHQKRHEGYFSRQHVCTVCDRKFHTKSTLQRHHDVIHGKKQFSCEYCPLRFATVQKLARHVRTHAGDRAYPCKYCNKSFIKSHHYTRHLRVKHEEETRAARGESEFRCEQCSESFATQDDLYYHSAIHATQNLICPLCQEKFENVDAVTSHIRTHVNGIEFMCEYCELVFTSKEKLDAHMTAAHDDEMTPRQELGLDESSLEADGGEADNDDDDEDNGLNVKEEGDHMVVEIKKAEGYMLRKGLEVGQIINTTSEDSEMESTYTELSTVDTLALASGSVPLPVPAKSEAVSSKATSSTLPAKAGEQIGILRKAEAVKRKAVDKEDSIIPRKKGQPGKVDSTTNNANSSEKSLRMLEKELQELKRTNPRPEKPVKTGEVKSKRQAAHSCTPKLRSTEEKKATSRSSTPTDKRSLDRRSGVKDSKEARYAVSSTKEDKSVSSTRDDKASTSERSSAVSSDGKKQDEVPDRPKAQETVKDKAAKEAREKTYSKEEASSSGKIDVAGTSNKRDSEDPEIIKIGDASSSEDYVVRRSTRPSKIKNYASMARDGAGHVQDDEVEEVLDDSDIAEVKEPDSRTTPGRRGPMKRLKSATPVAGASAAAAAAAASAPAVTPRRRPGRPRKDTPKENAAEADAPSNDGDSNNIDLPSQEASVSEEPKSAPEVPEASNAEPAPELAEANQPTSPVNNEASKSLTLVSPTGQTLKKVSIQALPPGVKPMPLPLASGPRRDVCQMQIGKKMVKVQKILMTKSEVEAMTKKGLLELKGGAMVLKRGIKFPEGEVTPMRSGLVSQQAAKKMSSNSAPSRCNFEGEET